ncbi:MAG: ParB/RepB/Spo0J family partition protein [Anaerovorax sp.]
MAGIKGRGLGKGLEALFNDVEISTKEIEEAVGDSISEGRVSLIDINNIKPNANQPRKNFSEEKIEELAKSIEMHGIIQPIMVRSATQGYELVAGERRWRAARKAGLKKVPCIVRELNEEQNMLVAIIENMQREDLNPMEESEALNQMISTYGLTQEEVSRSVGKSRPYITNALRLLKLPEEVKKMVAEGQLSNGHARTIAGVKDEKKQIELANLTLKEGLSVRQLEKLAKEEADQGMNKRAKARTKVKNREILTLEEDLKTTLGTKVSIKYTGKKGKIEIEYYNREELERLIELLRSVNE